MQLFLPEIEQFAEKDPLLYEIFYQIQSSINKIPLNSGAATPTPVAAIDQNTGLPITDSSGNPLFTIPQTTGSLPGNPSAATAVPGNENALYLQTDPTGLANSLFAFGGVWQRIMKIITANDLAGHGAPAQANLTRGAAVLQGLQYDDHGRPASAFFTNVTDNTGLFQGANPLSQSGTTTVILIAAKTWQFGGFTISFNSGSVDPGSFGTFSVFYDDPQYNGGAQTFFAVTAGGTTPISKRGRFFIGQITTAAGGGGSGSGGGNGGLCFSPYTWVITRIRSKPILLVEPGDEVLSLAGWVRVKRLLEHDYEGSYCALENGQFVTPKHKFFQRGKWVMAMEFMPIIDVIYHGKVYNIEIENVENDFDERHCYMLDNGLIAHNLNKY